MARERTLKAVYTFHTTTEAMKMEQPIPCPKDGVVKDVLVSVGDKVKSGAVLLSIE